LRRRLDFQVVSGASCRADCLGAFHRFKGNGELLYLFVLTQFQAVNRFALFLELL
jgi:hypothetical protein